MKSAGVTMLDFYKFKQYMRTNIKWQIHKVQPILGYPNVFFFSIWAIV